MVEAGWGAEQENSYAKGYPMNQGKRRKPYSERALVTRTTSRRFRAGTRKNKRLRNVGSFTSDKAVTR